VDRSISPVATRSALRFVSRATPCRVSAISLRRPELVVRRTDYVSAIVDERVRTPPGWRDAYGLRRGSVFGLSHNLEQLALARPARRHKGVRGLHWVGANTRPGNGVPLVLIGAMKTAEEALLVARAARPSWRESSE
jgi:phytoene dehydrogenase-like protein